MFNRLRSLSKPPSPVDDGPTCSIPILDPPGNIPTPVSSLDDTQQEKVSRLRKHFDEYMLPETDEYYENEKGFLTDNTLRRYLRARKWDELAAIKMLEATVQWRRTEKPECYDPEYISPEAETGKMYFSGFDKTGRPIWIMRPRLENSKNAERQVKHIIFSLERAIRLMPAGVENISIIVDFKDASSGHSPSVATCKKFLDILGNHYPERLGKAFVVSAPWVFHATFKIISVFMDPVTLAKIKFAIDKKDDSEKERQKSQTENEWVFLEDYIDVNQLESVYGGTYNFKYDFDVYWNALLDHTGRPYKVIRY
ncbi:hypothetical protein K450DRAFT_244883 [Umbelopsis ramanniana AG]|uniref:CRAL-TRIO domain-containing protein n=1 Tax=Umbelopsis ramanniana AG TaxID=1314678 RepID=A0AAD5HDT7_UMBRA|nr:uncharacterized protein K450DRAFT_244883 [Umbelopsis ramanniana AG]KAI8578866.1 hypothetical protein K450DRAFT_244883 [Umbelopsis ramanniana AG]